MMINKITLNPITFHLLLLNGYSNQKGRKRKLRLIVYAEPNEENQERKTELKIENELL